MIAHVFLDIMMIKQTMIANLAVICAKHVHFTVIVVNLVT